MADEGGCLSAEVRIVDDVEAPADGVPRLYWTGYADRPDGKSISGHLERHAERFRSTYLAFVHELGTSEYRGRPLYESLQTRDGFSFWWMNWIHEKAPLKSRGLFSALCFLALEDLLRTTGANRVTLHSTDPALREATASLCAANGIHFAAEGHVRRKREWTARRVYESLPYWLQAVVSLRHLPARWEFRRARRHAWFAGKNALFVCSYFYNLDSESARRGVFHSHQWEAIPAWWHGRGGRINWLHHYVPEDGRDVTEALALAERFNADAERQGRHAFVDSYLSIWTVLRAIRWWVWTMWHAPNERSMAQRCHTPGSSASLWPFLRHDWRTSIFGAAAMSNALWYVMFDAALGELPRQQRGVYLFEGQGWEAALVHAWRKHGHGELIAVPHSTMPFWYMNLYDDARCLAPVPGGKPCPHRWALNGPMAWRALASLGYPSERLAEAEALRFMYLEHAVAPLDRAVASGRTPRKLLVLGDSTPAKMHQMMQCVAAALAVVDDAVEVTVKCHPALRLESTDLPGLRCDFADGPIGDLLPRFDVALSSNTTSAGLDALLVGLPVIVFLDIAGINQSPLRGFEDATFVSSADELGAALIAPRRAHKPVRPADIFFLDSRLPRWARLLAVERDA